MDSDDTKVTDINIQRINSKSLRDAMREAEPSLNKFKKLYEVSDELKEKIKRDMEMLKNMAEDLND